MPAPTLSSRRPTRITHEQVEWVRARFQGEPGHGSMPRPNSAVIKLGEAIAALGKARFPTHATPYVKQFLDAVAARQPKIAQPLIRLFARPELMVRVDHLDVWVNNVGRGITRMPSELTDADLDAMIDVNVRSALYGMQEALPIFKAQGHGHFINVSSMLGRVPSTLRRSAYSASKHFLNSLTENFRTEVQETHPGIQFSLVSPGVVYTDFGVHAMHGGPDSRALPNGQPVEEVAEVIAGVIVSRRPDVYTRAGAKQMVAAHFAATGEDP